MARTRRKPTRSISPQFPRPPQGTYDPAIDANEYAAQRGYHDLQSDTSLQDTRAASDFGTTVEDINRQRNYGLADLLKTETRGNEDYGIDRHQIEQDFGYNLSDILTGRSRGTEDYHSDIAALDRQYQRLGGVQAQTANAAGVIRGGALHQALTKRTANEAIDRAPIDTNYQRFMDNSAQSEQRLKGNYTQALSALELKHTRLGEDVTSGRQRLYDEYGTGESTYKAGSNPWADAWLAKNPGQQLPGGPHDLGHAGLLAGLTYQRGVDDRATNLRRAGRELNAYSQDLAPTRYLQATGAPQIGTWNPPRRRRRP